MRPIELGSVRTARLFDRSEGWLRFLEREGILPPARRDDRGHRVYSLEEIEEIRRVAVTRQRGKRRSVGATT